MFKKRLDDEEFKAFVQQTPLSEYQVIGYYGSFQNCLTVIAKVLNVDISALKLKVDVKEALVAYKINERVALLFITDEKIYDFSKKIEGSGL